MQLREQKLDAVTPPRTKHTLRPGLPSGLTPGRPHTASFFSSRSPVLKSRLSHSLRCLSRHTAFPPSSSHFWTNVWTSLILLWFSLVFIFLLGLGFGEMSVLKVFFFFILWGFMGAGGGYQSASSLVSLCTISCRIHWYGEYFFSVEKVIFIITFIMLLLRQRRSVTLTAHAQAVHEITALVF